MSEIESTFLNPERRALTQLVKFDKKIVRAHGCDLIDDAGNRYLDLSSQYGALPFGHNPSFVWETLRRLEREQHPSYVQPLIAPASESLARILSEAAPGDEHFVIFTNSGAESIEVAIKVARARTGRRTILATHNGFHGKTLGAASATGTAIYRDPFLVDTRFFEHIPYGDLDALSRRLAATDVAAFVVEPIQGEGGMIVPPPGYLKGVQDLCRTHGTLFVADEVQTGLGRTGRLFACEWHGCEPDVIALAKALGGGVVPLGACIVTRRAWSKEIGLYHSSTFANNQVTCSIGLSVLERLLRDDRAEIRAVEQLGVHLISRLERLVEQFPGCFASVRGRGLMLGLELKPWPSEDAYFMGMVRYLGYQVALLCGYLLNEHGIVVLPTVGRNHVLRIQPAFNVTPEQVDRLIAALAEAARLIESGRFDALISYATGGSARPCLAHPPSPPSVTSISLHSPHRGRFAFLMHPTDFEDLMRCMPSGCSAYPADQRRKLEDWMRAWRNIDAGPSAVHYVQSVPSLQGGHVDGWLISSLLTPREMLRLRTPERKALLERYMSVAQEVGAQVVGLGAFTSIISRGGLDIVDSQIPLTTGNGLTAMMSAEALLQVARERGSPLEEQRVAVIGASGSVGRLAAMALAPRCKQLVLIGNPANPSAIRDLEAVAGEIYRGLLTNSAVGRLDELREWLEQDNIAGELLGDPHAQSDEAHRTFYCRIRDGFHIRLRRTPRILAAVDLHRALTGATGILSVTSNGKSFVDPQMLAPGAVVCDAARPGDFGAGVGRERDDVCVFEGGLVHLPAGVQFGRNNVLGHPAGVTLACLSETIALAMEGVRRHYCLGNRIAYAEAMEVYGMALEHGFRCNIPQSEGAGELNVSNARVACDVPLQIGR